MALTKISSNLVADDAIVTGKIADGGVATADLAANAVTTAKIAQNNVTAHHIADGSITTTQLGADAVTAAKMADDAVSEEHLDKTIISDMTQVTPVAGDFVLIGDTSDSNNLKKAPISGITALATVSGISSSADATAITIDSSENVGIGTTTPSQILNVEATSTPVIEVSTLDDNNPASASAIDLVEKQPTHASNTATFGQTGVYGYRIQLNGSDNTLRVKSGSQTTTNDRITLARDTGNVGIVTTSPDFTLDVEADKDTWLSRIYNTGSDANAQALLVRSDATAAHDAMVLGVYADSGYKMVVRSTGNVGIGTSSPTSLLGTFGSGSGGLAIAKSQPAIVFHDTDNSAYKSYLGQAATHTYLGYIGGGDLILQGSTSATEKFRFTDQGTMGFSGVGSGNFAGSLLISHDGTTGTLNNAYYNTGFGYEVFDKITSGDSNTSVGNQAGYDLTTGSANTLMGRLAGGNIDEGNYNTIGGYQSGDSITDGIHNTAWGYEALGAHNGNYNTAIGDRALHANTGGVSNVAIGSAAMFGSANSADQNTAVGANSMEAITTGQGNSTLGHYAGYGLTSGSYNVAIGRRSLMGTCTGTFNIAIGYEAMKGVTSGSENFCMGRDAGHDITSGSQNVAVGHESLTKLTTSSGCAALGFQALEKATGHSNVGFGYKAGENITSGTNNIMIGKNSGHSSSPAGAVSSGSNTICLGDDNIGSLFCTQSSINTSDRRDKADITNFTGGLDFVKKMQPVTYKWDRRSWQLPKDEDGNVTNDDITKVTPDGSKKETITHVGFIAQDVETLEKEIGFASDDTNRLLTNLTDDGHRYGIKYERIVTVLVNAVKELNTKLEAAEARIEKLES